MDETKNLFSERAEAYAAYRPHYPQALFDFLLSLPAQKGRALDCGTGNGQVAGVLADHFRQVEAIDISESQLKHAVHKANIHYSVQRAEQTSFPDNSFDLVTVAQAIHWFDFDAFYAEMKRILKPGGVLAVIGYALCSIDTFLDPRIQHFYLQVVGPFWDKERRYLDEHYQTIPFPLKEVPVPQFSMEYTWTLEEFASYVGTWSAVQHFIKKNEHSPMEDFQRSLSEHWNKGEYKKVSFPLLLRVGINMI